MENLQTCKHGRTPSLLPGPAGPGSTGRGHWRPCRHFQISFLVRFPANLARYASPRLRPCRRHDRIIIPWIDALRSDSWSWGTTLKCKHQRFGRNPRSSERSSTPGRRDTRRQPRTRLAQQKRGWSPRVPGKSRPCTLVQGGPTLKWKNRRNPNSADTLPRRCGGRAG